MHVPWYRVCSGGLSSLVDGRFSTVSEMEKLSSEVEAGATEVKADGCSVAVEVDGPSTANRWLGGGSARPIWNNRLARFAAFM